MRPAPTLTDSQLVRLRQLLSQTRSDEARFCAWLGVARLEDVLQNDFKHVVNEIYRIKCLT